MHAHQMRVHAATIPMSFDTRSVVTCAHRQRSGQRRFFAAFAFLAGVTLVFGGYTAPLDELQSVRL